MKLVLIHVGCPRQNHDKLSLFMDEGLTLTDTSGAYSCPHCQLQILARIDKTTDSIKGYGLPMREDYTSLPKESF